jgi:hypothetical protein
MSWERQIEVTGGKIWSQSTDQEDVYRLEGIVECGEEYLVWFTKLRYPDIDGRLLGLPDGQELHVAQTGTEPTSTLSVGPRIVPIREAAPPNFLALCHRLLAPSPRKKWHGYACEISLRIAGGAHLDNVLIRDEPDVRDQVGSIQFMHLQPPPTLIGHHKHVSFTSREMIELVLKLDYGWPLPYEASR